MYDAIILAGGESDKFSGCAAERCSALLMIGGRPMVSYVAAALAQSEYVRKIYVAGQAAKLANCPLPASAVVIEGGAGIIETIEKAVRALGHEEKVLVATADMPFLTREGVDDFVRLCKRREAECHYAVVAKKVYEEAFPASRRTYVKLKEGSFTGGNLFLTDAPLIFRCAAVAGQITANRKKPWRICRMLGWGFIVKFALGILSLPETEARVSELLGIKGAVWETKFPEIAADVDKMSDLEFACQEISKMRN
jgi:molybdopterin-guanine dinucleotide biosynthesis protein A